MVRYGGGGILARWISNFDCEQETDFWYCIKDTPFDIGKIKSKKRYYIKKGIENFVVKEINSAEYLDELYVITDKALQTYDDYKKPEDKGKFREEIQNRKDLIYLGAFDKETQTIQGYIKIKEYDSYVDFMSMKVNPEFEKKQINAALVNKLCEKYNDRLGRGNFYICDGMKAVSHKTNFQDYLEKNFMFRKAYCQLHMAYPKKIRVLIAILWNFKKMIYLINNKRHISVMNKIVTILQYEEIARNTDKQLKRNGIV